MTKDEIRNLVLRERRGLALEWIAERSRRIQEKLVAHPAFGPARVVCAYLAMRGEVQTDWLIARTRALGKTLCVPAYRLDEACYGVARCTDRTALYVGPGGVREPAQPEWVTLEEIDFMVVPGVAFDRQGGRVGHGKGHYDRLLRSASRQGFPAIGVAFDFQLFDRVPMGDHDVRMDAVMTEKNSVDVHAFAHE